MKRFINFGSIDRFESVYFSLKKKLSYVGLDQNEEPVFDEFAPMPILEITGTEKIHGTNAGVCYNILDGFWVQSRKNIITREKDNAGCAAAAEDNKVAWLTVIRDLAEHHDIDLRKNIITVYYEWCGDGIMKHTCVSGLSKRPIIFQHFKVSPIEPQIDQADANKEDAQWFSTKINHWWVSDIKNDIYNVGGFGLERFNLDMNKLNSPSV